MCTRLLNGLLTAVSVERGERRIREPCGNPQITLARELLLFLFSNTQPVRGDKIIYQIISTSFDYTISEI